MEYTWELRHLLGIGIEPASTALQALNKIHLINCLDQFLFRHHLRNGPLFMRVSEVWRNDCFNLVWFPPFKTVAFDGFKTIFLTSQNGWGWRPQGDSTNSHRLQQGRSNVWLSDQADIWNPRRAIVRLSTRADTRRPCSALGQFNGIRSMQL